MTEEFQEPVQEPASASLEGRVAIVTGAGSRSDGIGNGRAASILMARAGARIVLIDAVREAALKTQEMIAADGGEAIVIDCDVTDEKSCKAAIDETLKTFGRVDILVNNVGIGGPKGNATDLDLGEWEHAMRVNLTSMVLMARYAIPAMAAQGKGAIINVSSVAGMIGGHPHLMYPTSKGAVINMTRAMAAHHGQSGVRVNCVCPGMVHTPMVSTSGMTPELRAERRARSFLGTEGNGWDVGHAIRFLASDEARWITGAILPVDAGSSAGRHSYSDRKGLSETRA